MTKLILVLLSFLHISVAHAATNTIYVDGNLSSNCSGNYSIQNRSCSSSDGNAYKTIHEGISALSSGQTLFIRAGTYTDTVDLGGFSSMTTISAMSGENVIWQNFDINKNFVFLAQDAKNITFKDLNFKGKRYLGTNQLSWTQVQGNVWRTTSAQISWVEMKIGCNTSTFLCTKATQSYENETRTSVADIENNGTDGDWYQAPEPNSYIYVYSTSGSPANRTDFWETGYGITIGNNSSGTGNIVIDHCTFDGNGHTHLKGGYKWWVKNSTFRNVGTDFNDHHIYTWGVLSSGGEAVFENNYFVNDQAMGAAIHIFGKGYQVDNIDPRYQIIRNNVFQGNGYWGIALWGDNVTVVNNSMYILGGTKAIEIGGANHDDTITKNILVGASGVTIETDSASSITITNNFYARTSTFQRGTCSSCSISGNSNTEPGWINQNPSVLSDYKFTSTSPAAAAGAGANINLFSSSSSSTPSPTNNPPTPDVNKSGSIDGVDYVLVLNHIGQTSTISSQSTGGFNLDLNSDGKVDINDLNTLILNIK